ncbi:MAG: type VI secretion system baseplate subunit TssG [Phycisphaerales bacterium]|nr:type VI secretion system baseplate subunit TssG [Phycisphaerales bacterium]
MAHPDRNATYALILRLMEKPYAYDFFAAVRRIECAKHAPRRIGASLRLRDDPIRFAQEPSLAFAASTLHAYAPGKSGAADRMTVNFMGLFGPNGALPLHLTEYARDRERNSRDKTFVRFCDIFHHRMIALFYRAWAVNQPAVSFDRVADDPDSDRFGVYVASMIGLGERALLRRDAVPDIAKQHFAGRLALQTKPPGGLAALLADFFRMPCTIEEFVGHWIDIPVTDRLRMGRDETMGRLGSTAVIGSSIWDCTQRFRIRIGPLSFAQYSRLLPTGRSFARLVGWVRNYVGYEYLWDAKLVLKKEEVPAITLGGGAMLGWTSWLKTKPFGRDADDLVLRAPDEGDLG